MWGYRLNFHVDKRYIGYIPWPWMPVTVTRFGEYLEVIDEEGGISVIDLSDVFLDELY